MVKFMKYSISLALLLFLLTSCGGVRKNAEYYLEQSKCYYAAGNDTLALTMLDSVAILFPKEIENRRIADTLRWEIQMKQCVTSIPMLDSVIEIAQYKLDSLVKFFKFYKDTLYQDIGTYEHRILTTERNTSRCYLKPSVDENGAVTFTTGACVNSFTLEQPVKVLLNDRLVKLFKLFKGEKVTFTLGYDAISDDIIQTKVKFETTDVTITAILSCDDSMLRQFPVNAVRGRADASYPYSINMNREQLIQTINRLMLFTTSNNGKEIVKPNSTFEFKKDSVVIYDVKKENKEEIYYTNTSCNIEDAYVAIFDLNDLRATLETCSEQYVTLNFGDGQAAVLVRGNIKNVIPECRVN